MARGGGFGVARRHGPRGREGRFATKASAVTTAVLNSGVGVRWGATEDFGSVFFCPKIEEVLWPNHLLWDHLEPFYVGWQLCHVNYLIIRVLFSNWMLAIGWDATKLVVGFTWLRCLGCAMIAYYEQDCCYNWLVFVVIPSIKGERTMLQDVPLKFSFLSSSKRL